MLREDSERSICAPVMTIAFVLAGWAGCIYACAALLPTVVGSILAAVAIGFCAYFGILTLISIVLACCYLSHLNNPGEAPELAYRYR